MDAARGRDTRFKSEKEARACLEKMIERAQPAYANEDEARERYKRASREERDRQNLEEKWNAAYEKSAEADKKFAAELASVKRDLPGFVW
jgi:hypothetical protein